MAITKKSVEENAKDMLHEYENESDDSLHKDMAGAPKEVKDKVKLGKELQNFLATKKRKFKNTKYRRKYDAILGYMAENLINTETYQAAMKSQATNIAYSFVYENGSYTQIPILARNNANDNVTRIPTAKEPIAFAKLMTAVSVLAGRVPDATFKSADKIYARAQYELWKHTWEDSLGNGLTTLRNFYQNQIGSGFAAYRVYPRKVEHKSKGQERVLFDGIYRQALDTSRVWVGNSVNLYDRWSWGEVIYDIDQEKTRFLEKYPDAKYFDLEYSGSAQESKVDESVKQDFITIRYYEDPVRNKYCVACGNFPIYEGEMPNEDGFGHVIWTNCFVKDGADPYGVGIVEIMRANTEMYDYIMRLSAEQVEAEISPLLFGTNTGVGEMTYRRGPNVINPKGQGTNIDVVKTSGNVQQSIIFADKQKQVISENTGINDILAGQAGEGTLGATVILKEAALNRLTIPRNNVVSCLELDAYITVSWIKQTYSVEKIMKFSTSEELNQFIQNNPSYFVEEVEREYEESSGEDKTETETEDGEGFADVMPDQKTKSITVSVSKKVPLGFDLKMNLENPELDEIEELSDKYNMPSAKLMKLLEERGHVSDSLTIVVDGSSMLLPSEEINKQRMNEIFTIINPIVMQAIQMKDQMPDMARALIKSAERILEVNKESIYDWVPKDIVDMIQKAVAQPQPSVADIAQSAAPGTAEQGTGGPMGLTGKPPTPNQIPNPIGDMTQQFKSGFNKEIVNPLKGAMNASVGRAAKPFGNK